MAFDRLEPFTPGEQVMQRQLATIAMILANVYRDRDEHPKLYEIKDFLPASEKDGMSEPEKKQQSWQDQLAMVTVINAALGGGSMKGQNE